MSRCAVLLHAGSIPSFDVVKGKNVQTIQWYQAVHPVVNSMLGKNEESETMCVLSTNACVLRIDKTVVETHSSALALSPTLALCCGKDGQLRLFRNSYEVTKLVRGNRSILLLPYA